MLKKLIQTKSAIRLIQSKHYIFQVFLFNLNVFFYFGVTLFLNIDILHLISIKWKLR